MIQSIDNYNSTVLLSTNPTNKPVIINDSSSDTVSFDTVLDRVTEENSSEDVADSLSAGSLEDIFVRASKKYNISLNLLKAVAKAESDFNPNCVSSSGAMGVMQLMPETAKSLGVTDAFDPEQNIMGGAKYLAEQLKNFNQDVSLALAAYNAGPGNVRKYNGIPPFEETNNYVSKILNYMKGTVEIPENLSASHNSATPKIKIPERSEVTITAGSDTLTKASEQLSASTSKKFRIRNA